MSNGKLVLGALAGLAAGAILGILLAPEKGSVTRKQIMDEGEEYAESLKSKLNSYVESITGAFQKTGKEAEELVSKGKSKYEDTKRDILNTVSEVKNNAS